MTTIAPAEEETPKFEEPAAIIENGFAFDGAEFSIRENGNALALAVTRQGSIDTSASVAWATYEGSALAHQDYASFDWSPIQFAAGETEKTIYVPIVSDSIAEPNETFHVTLSNPSPDMVLAHPATVTVTIVDDDV